MMLSGVTALCLLYAASILPTQAAASEDVEGWVSLFEGKSLKVFPDFGEDGRGRILLQDHGEEVRFRSIKIRAL
jgi:hypothetical protein